MTRKSLIVYSSLTGNTEKVAVRFAQVFKKKGWEYDLVKVDTNTDFFNPGFAFEDYDFLCVGSPVQLNSPAETIIKIMNKNPLSGHFGDPTREEVAVERFKRNDPNYRVGPKRPPGYDETHPPRPRKIIPGPKKGVVFVTYGGHHLGPKEAEPSLSTLEVEMEHLRFKCIGKFACPGRVDNREGLDTWHGDIRNRPNERDLLKAEIFLEEKLEEPD
jgi:flavodoxin